MHYNLLTVHSKFLIRTEDDYHHGEEIVKLEAVPPSGQIERHQTMNFEIVLIDVV